MKGSSEKHCVDCHAMAPDTDTNYTLIEHGWRLTPRSENDGRRTMELRCPSCWASHRAHAGISGASDLALPPSSYPKSKKTISLT